MKKPLFLFSALLFLVFGSAITAARPRYEVAFTKPYSRFPVLPRIENSGIYLLRGFSCSGDSILFSCFDSDKIFQCSGNGDIIELTPGSTKDNTFQYSNTNNIEFTYRGEEKTIRFSGSDGTYSSEEGGVLRCSRGGNSIMIEESGTEHSGTVTLRLADSPAFVELLGATQNEYYILAEFITSHIPLTVVRKMLVASREGKLINTLMVPAAKYLSNVREFFLAGDGTFYHLLSYPDRMTIVRWFDLTIPAGRVLEYPETMIPRVHHNSVLPGEEAQHPEPPQVPELAADRNLALQLGDSYANHLYRCSAANLAPVTLRDPGGDSVRTPPWLIAGANARVAYRWGGFNTLAQYNDGLAAGKFAGDIHTAGTSSYAVGVDCSGFVSRCWQMSYHASTSSMPSITTQYASWDSLKPADAIHKVGHVRLFIERMLNGAFRVVESSGRDWSVSYWSYAPSDLTEYTPRFYNSMNAAAIKDFPVLQSVEPVEGTKARLQWSGDTTGVIGYRLYKSINGTTWSRVLDESVLKGTSFDFPLTDSTALFRVSLVRSINGTPGESYWSNTLGVSIRGLAAKKYIIINGFQRNTGSWRGVSDKFVNRYALALSQKGVAFASCKSQSLTQMLPLTRFNGAFWFTGDESTADETFSAPEQAILKEYLEAGKALFVNGSEIGYDLVSRGTAEDKLFYSAYLKAQFLADNSGSKSVSGAANSIFSNIAFPFGQLYDEEYPDEIAPNGGSVLCVNYSNGKGAGILFNGTFGSSAHQSKLVYLAFPLETTANDSAFSAVITRTIDFFGGVLTGTDKTPEMSVKDFFCSAAYPNPFNGQTVLNVTLPLASPIRVSVYNILGQKVLSRDFTQSRAGLNVLSLDLKNLPTGIYVCSVHANGMSAVKKIQMIR